LSPITPNPDVYVRNDPWRAEHVSGGQNEVFASRLMGTDNARRTLLNVRTREKLKGQMRVVLRTVSPALFTVWKKLVEKRKEVKQN